MSSPPRPSLRHNDPIIGPFSVLLGEARSAEADVPERRPRREPSESDVSAGGGGRARWRGREAPSPRA